MTNNEREPREFWIGDNGYENQMIARTSDFSIPQEVENVVNAGWEKEFKVIHVIEYSAVDRLEAINADLLADIDRQKAHVAEAVERMHELRSALREIMRLRSLEEAKAVADIALNPEQGLKGWGAK